VLYIVHFTAFCLGGPFFSGHGVDLFSVGLFQIEQSSKTVKLLIIEIQVLLLWRNNE